MFPLQFLLIMLSARWEKARRDERGATAVEWVIITAILVLLAVGLGATITALVKNKADTIDLDK